MLFLFLLLLVSCVNAQAPPLMPSCLSNSNSVTVVTSEAAVNRPRLSLSSGCTQRILFQHTVPSPGPLSYRMIMLSMRTFGPSPFSSARLSRVVNASSIIPLTGATSTSVTTTSTTTTTTAPASTSFESETATATSSSMSLQTETMATSAPAPLVNGTVTLIEQFTFAFDSVGNDFLLIWTPDFHSSVATNISDPVELLFEVFPVFALDVVVESFSFCELYERTPGNVRKRQTPTPRPTTPRPTTRRPTPRPTPRSLFSTPFPTPARTTRAPTPVPAPVDPFQVPLRTPIHELPAKSVARCAQLASAAENNIEPYKVFALPPFQSQILINVTRVYQNAYSRNLAPKLHIWPRSAMLRPIWRSTPTPPVESVAFISQRFFQGSAISGPTLNWTTLVANALVPRDVASGDEWLLVLEFVEPNDKYNVAAEPVSDVCSLWPVVRNANSVVVSAGPPLPLEPNNPTFLDPVLFGAVPNDPQRQDVFAGLLSLCPSFIGAQLTVEIPVSHRFATVILVARNAAARAIVNRLSLRVVDNSGEQLLPARVALKSVISDGIGLTFAVPVRASDPPFRRLQLFISLQPPALTESAVFDLRYFSYSCGPNEIAPLDPVFMSGTLGNMFRASTLGPVPMCPFFTVQSFGVIDGFEPFFVRGGDFLLLVNEGNDPCAETAPLFTANAGDPISFERGSRAKFVCIALRWSPALQLANSVAGFFPNAVIQRGDLTPFPPTPEPTPSTRPTAAPLNSGQAASVIVPFFVICFVFAFFWIMFEIKQRRSKIRRGLI
jgi:hypothetical protein